MFSVCRTAPTQGTARYASRCSACFHMNVPTRWSASTPRPRRALASWAARRPASAYVRRLVPSPVQVTTSRSPNTDVPYRMTDVIVSGTSIIVLCTEPPPGGCLTCIPDSAMSQVPGSRPGRPGGNARRRGISAFSRHLRRFRLGAGILAELGVNAQPGHRARHRAFHGAQADAQRRGYFRLGHVLEVPEHDGGPHPLRQPVKGTPDYLRHIAFRA